VKIIRLSAENLKRLSAVEITPTGDVVTLTGRNGQGKSSVLDSIYAALAGADAIPEKPIRRGETSAKVQLDLGEIKVTRRFRENGSSDVIVEAETGARFPSPQRMLDGLVGKLTFDPLQFSREEPKKQLEILRSLVVLDVDVDALAGLNMKDFEERTDINRRAKALRAQADGIALPDDCPTERRDTTKIADRLQRAGEHNAAIERARARLATLAQQIGVTEQAIATAEAALPGTIAAIERRRDNDIAKIEEQIQALHNRISEIKIAANDDIWNANEAQEKRLGELRAANDRLAQQIAAEPEPPAPEDAAAIRAELTSAEDTNALVDRWKQKSALVADAAALEERSAKLTEQIDARRKARADAIAAAKFPIEGLSFGDGEVLYNDLPLSQASTAEQIEISMAIAMACNPKIRIVCIREGEKLDADGLKLVAKMAKENDYQVWLEDVRSTDPLAIIMEEGHVRGAPPPAAKSAISTSSLPKKDETAATRLV
jgi:DNA repair exonuclease SbcCD ATPase subunit